MSFEINHIQENGLNILEIKNRENATAIQILPDVGALWHGWNLQHASGNINLIDHYQDKDDLEKNLADSFKSANLSPFACRIPDGKYIYEGKQYEFVNKFKDGNAIHGLLFNKKFEEGEIKQTGDRASVSFQYAYRRDDAGYPFDYDCTVTYALHRDNQVTLETQIKNISANTIPLVDGWHPYFTTGSIVDDCILQFYANQEIEFDEELIPTGQFLPYDTFWDERKIGQIKLDNSFMLDHHAPQPRCTFFDPVKKIHLHIYPSENYPILQLYIPPSRRSIAIETLSGAPDAFNNGIELALLSPGETKVFSVTYGVSLGS